VCEYEQLKAGSVRFGWLFGLPPSLRGALINFRDKELIAPWQSQGLKPEIATEFLIS